MPEHTPAPTPSRAVYGFVLHLCSNVLFKLYFVWAVVPESWFVAINLTYLAQRYWAVAIPIFLLTILATFAFIIYPSLNLCMTPSIDDMRTVKEQTHKQKTIVNHNKNVLIHNNSTLNNYYCCCETIEKCSIDEFLKENKNAVKYNVPMVDDLCIADVSRTLYLKS